jgi:ABC-type uncharacterized transport system involved in gliding motility auxiliary subunit
MAAKWFKSRQGKYTGYVVVYTLVVVAVLAAVNFLANRYDKSYDSTSNKQFSLSDQTIKLVKGLKSDLRLTYFGATTDFPSARDLLDRYESLSPKLHVTYLDPVRKPQQAKSAGYRSDSPVVVENGPKREGAKQLTEEEITAAIIRAEKTGERNICFLSAGGEHSIEDSEQSGYSIAKELVERDNYKTRTLTLKGAAPEAGKTVNVGQAPAAASFEIPKDCTVLVIGGPQTSYPPAVVNAIKTYVEGGGRALFMLDDPLRIGRVEPPAENSDLVKLLADWGVTVNKDLALDLSGVGGIFGLGPEVPVILQYESHPITEPLTRVPTAFPIVRSLEVKSGDKTTVQKIVATTEDSVAVTDIGPGGSIDPRKGKRGPLTLAAAGTYSGGATKGRFVVVGTSLWAQNSVLGSRSLGNRDLLANMVNWLNSDEDLISIRPKTPEDRPLNITAQKMSMLFWLSVVVFPLAVVGLGLGTWWRRR